MTERDQYVLGHSDRELERLSVQARLVDPITRGFLRDAGLRSGMRVLDVGSGAGDVAFLATELVGEAGEVVGVDRAQVALETASRRAAARSLRDVSFRAGDPAEIAFDRPFDAVIGRYVLMVRTSAQSLNLTPSTAREVEFQNRVKSCNDDICSVKAGN
jgi:2-polyprenyl-3-methyl-5-hydroxy-6-metoxy-1,4-benzoquinol methylase